MTRRYCGASKVTSRSLFSKPPFAGSSLPSIYPIQTKCLRMTWFSRSFSKSLRGGDILDVRVNAFYAGNTDPNPERWLVNAAMIEAEMAKARKAKAEPSSENGKSQRRTGFGV